LVNRFSFVQAAIRYCSLFSTLVLLTACGSAPLIAPDSAPLSDQALLTVPFYPQQDYHCGPAALAGLFNYHGTQLSPGEVARWVYIPDRQGSLQIEMQAAIRQAGFLAYPLDNNIEAILLEVDAGNPVLVLQNLGLAWWPQWHYSNVIGYDLKRQKIILNSGKNAGYTVALSTFNNTWSRAGSWGIVPLPPSQLPATATAHRYLKAASDLEKVGQENSAYTAYTAALQRWPEQPLALMGLGNIYYAREEYRKAVAKFAELARIQPENALAWNNLAYAYQAYGCPTETQKSIERAGSLAPHDSRIASSFVELNSSREQMASPSYCREVLSEGQIKNKRVDDN
jgi:tetratricopeptide (TPR) repeat protein